MNELQREYLNTKIDVCLGRLEIGKIHEAMTALNWTWALLGKVPSPYDLEQEARHLLWRAAEQLGETVKAGGLEAVWVAKNSQWECAVRFVFEEANSLSFWPVAENIHENDLEGWAVEDDEFEANDDLDD